MTVEGLLDAIAGETKIALEGFCLRSGKGNPIPINIYTQNLPLKGEKDDEKLYPYVCVGFDHSNIENSYDGKEISDIFFVVGVIDREKDNQGWRDVIQMTEKIKQYFFCKGLIQNAFRFSYPIRRMLQQEDSYPYFIGGIEAKCELFIVTEEDKWI